MLKIYPSQVLSLTIASIKSRYRGSWTGLFWVILNPLIMFVAQSFVFHYLLKINVDNYLLFLVARLLPWLFISQTLEMCTSLFVMQRNLLKSFPIHPLVILLAQVLDNAFNFAIGFIIALVPILISYDKLGLSVLLIFPSFVVLMFNVSCLAWLLASVNVFFRDTRFIVTFLLSVGFFLTPIFYPVELLPANCRWLATINPIFYMIQPFHYSVYSFGIANYLQATFLSILIGAGFLALGYLFWRKQRNAIYNYL